MKTAVILSVIFSLWLYSILYLIPNLKPVALPADFTLAVIFSMLYSVMIFVCWQLPAFLVALVAIEKWKVRGDEFTIHQATFAVALTTIIAWFVFRVDMFTGLADTATFVALAVNIGIPTILSWPGKVRNIRR